MSSAGESQREGYVSASVSSLTGKSPSLGSAEYGFAPSKENY